MLSPLNIDCDIVLYFFHHFLFTRFRHLLQLEKRNTLEYYVPIFSSTFHGGHCDTTYSTGFDSRRAEIASTHLWAQEPDQIQL